MKSNYLFIIAFIITVTAIVRYKANDFSDSTKDNPNYNQKLPRDSIKRDNIKTDVFLDKTSQTPSYQYNSEQVYEWIQSYPNDKDKLLEVAISEDPYAAQGIEVNPHTSDQINQEKFGAMRVMALQALYDNENNKEDKIKNLNYIIENAKDPVIVSIAESIMKSSESGRDYVEDFLEAAGK